ncbi:MAG: hypothetical protein HOY78_21945 [Saccharothrix sp.]|nr:hypothetical protein [Saccharothrix sp.]
METARVGGIGAAVVAVNTVVVGVGGLHEATGSVVVTVTGSVLAVGFGALVLVMRRGRER